MTTNEMLLMGEAVCMSGDYCVKSQMSYNDKKLVLEEHKLTYTDYDLKEKKVNKFKKCLICLM